MKIFNKFSAVAVSAVAVVLGSVGSMTAHAATSPNLGTAASFVILSSTYTNTVGGTTLTGDLGYTTGPAVAPTVNGSTFSPPSTKYSGAGTDQASALSSLNSESCTSISGPLNAVIIGGNPAGTFPPGCYETTGAMTITLSTTVTLDLTAAGAVGSTWVFRAAGGALTTGADAIVALANGASACNVFWAPTGATTLGANTTFKGTVIDAAGITIGSTVGWAGRALAFGGTISTDTDTISSTSCTAATALATLRVIKDVQNDDGDDQNADDFTLYVKLAGTDISGSPAVGVASPGRSYSLSAGTYVVSEDEDSAYNQSFSGDCDANGSVTLAAGDNKTCTVTNDDKKDDEEDTKKKVTTSITPTPKLPAAGVAPQEKNISWNSVALAGVLMLVSTSLVVVTRKHTV